MQKILQNGAKTTELQQFVNKGLTNPLNCGTIKTDKRKGNKTMARLRLEKYLGQWQLHNVASGRLLATTTEETQMVLRQMANTNGAEFTLEVV